MGGRGGAGGGIGAGEFGRGRGMSLARFLSQQDINRANAASVIDMGDIIRRTFERNAAEINGLALSDAEKKDAVKQMATLATTALKTAAGAVNYTDLNRVAGAVLYVAEELAASGYSVTVTAKQGWTETDIPTQADIDQYLADIAEIRSALPVPADAPKVPTMPLDYRKANDIESILILVDQLVQNIAKSWFYSGDLYSNEIK